MPSQQSDKFSTVPKSLSRLLSVIKENDDSFTLVVSTDQYVFGLPSHEIIVAKEDIEFMMNFDNITATCISLYMRYNIISFYFLFSILRK